MSDGAALLAAICAHPAEDTPRLAYADWLDGQETVRVPCSACNGKKVLCDRETNFPLVKCRTCHGAGTVIDTTNADRAELVRVQVKIERDFPIPPGGGMRPGECTQCWARRVHTQTTNGPCRCSPELRTLRARESALLGDGARWRKGPACAACGGSPPTFPLQRGDGPFKACVACWHTGDAGGLMRSVMVSSDPEDARKDAWIDRVEFVRGFPRVHCTLADAYRETDTRVAQEGETVIQRRIAPTPWALAVVRHHRGCELWLDDRTPYHNGAGHCWYNDARTHSSETGEWRASLPTALYEALWATQDRANVYPRWLAFASPDLARLALARATAAFARGHSQKETAP